MDRRYLRLGQILVDYSTTVKKGDRVIINMGGTEAWPLVKAVYREIIKRGAEAEIIFNHSQLTRDLLKYGHHRQLLRTPGVKKFSIEWANVWFGISAVGNPFELAQFSPAKTALLTKVAGRLSKRRVAKCRWVICRVPTPAFAQKAQLSQEEIEHFFFKATLRDWAKETAHYQKLAEIFQQAKEVKITGKKTELTFSTSGRRYVVDDGKNNMPGGEIFTAPEEESVNGQVYFEFPALRSGRVIKDISLEFKNGQVTKAKASENLSVLKEALRTDAGAKYLGEFGIGLNYGIKRFTFETLFDEKIGGTIHLALGQAYKECGGRNRSHLHWDLVKDLRRQGEIWLDGQKVFEKGKFLM